MKQRDTEKAAQNLKTVRIAEAIGKPVELRQVQRVRAGVSKNDFIESIIVRVNEIDIEMENLLIKEAKLLVPFN